MPELFRLFLQIAVILLAARLVGMLFKKIGQPQVVGEMAAGILLGPSLLGWLAPGLSATLFPPASLGYLSALSEVGLVLFMFQVGLSLNPKELYEHGHAAVLTSHVSIVTPFCLGSLIAIRIYPHLSDDSVPFTSFALFMGAAMSITAFPVLARILAERKLLRTKLGTLSVACAAVDDVTGWCILAIIIAAVRVTNGFHAPWVTIGAAVLYILVMLLGVKRIVLLFERSFRRQGQLDEQGTAFLVLLIIASALATEAAGIHFLFGAFLMGVIMPKGADFVDHVLQKFESLTVVVLLPLFFAFSGLRTSIGLVSGGGMWIDAVIIIALAIAGKLGGSAIAGRMAGMQWRDAAALGILMNTRGLMELVILNIGLDIGVISPGLFSILVLMALVTTVMTTPLLDWVSVQFNQREAGSKTARLISETNAILFAAPSNRDLN
jgi:Kef-type K+ transport system membrane component KefB